MFTTRSPLNSFFKANLLIFIVFGILLLLLLLTAIFRHPSPLHEAVPARPTSSIPVDAGWKTYTEPHGYFRISVPNDWPITVDPNSEYSEGTSQGVTQKWVTNVITFGTEYSTTKHFIRLQVRMTTPPNTDCRDAYERTINGFPASLETATGQQWYIDTNLLSYNLAYGYSGRDGLISHPLNFIYVPQPSAALATDQATIDRVIDSFTPLHQVPVRCKK